MSPGHSIGAHLLREQQRPAIDRRIAGLWLLLARSRSSHLQGRGTWLRWPVSACFSLGCVLIKSAAGCRRVWWLLLPPTAAQNRTSPDFAYVPLSAMSDRSRRVFKGLLL